jgi:transcriptional regulator with XRE-family HTH domain
MSEVKAGRKVKIDPIKVAAWRQARKASIKETAARFGIGDATVKRYCQKHGAEAEQARADYRIEQEIREAEDIEYASGLLEIRLAWAREAHEEYMQNPTTDNYFEAIMRANQLVPREYRNKKPS